MDAFVLRLFLSVGMTTFMILGIFLIKRLFSEHISVKMHYKIWYFIFVSLITSFFPWRILGFGEMWTTLKNMIFSNEATLSEGSAISKIGVSSTQNTDLLHDFSVSVNKSPDILYYVFMVVWLTGILIFLGVLIKSNIKLYQLKKSAKVIKDQNVNRVLEECVKTVGITRKISLRETPLITSPFTFGLFKPYILIPKKTRETFSLKELKYVFLHELCHQKNKDVFINYIMWIFQIIYWFNPLAWFALRKMRTDREFACDGSVLNLLDDKGIIEYGHTIIHFADRKHKRMHGIFAPGIGGTKKQIKQRIRNIVNYSRDSRQLKLKSKIIGWLLGAFALLLAPLSTVTASIEDVYQLLDEDVIYEDLSSYFDDDLGSFVLYDASNEQYQIYNQKLSEQRVSPNSTYKIYSALFALETGVISRNSNTKKWDGSIYPFKEWNKNQSLSTALGNSVNWYFQNIDKEIGRKQLQHYFSKIKYGNEDISTDLKSYWMESSLKISPIEQVQLLYALEENKYGFNRKNIEEVKKGILVDEQNDRQLYGKTGTGTINGVDSNGWFIGFVKKADNTYYFALNIKNKNGKTNGSKAAKIAKEILRDKNIY